jgi:hypothetical protein
MVVMMWACVVTGTLVDWGDWVQAQDTRAVDRRNAGSVDVGGGVDSLHDVQIGRVNLDDQARTEQRCS